MPVYKFFITLTSGKITGVRHYPSWDIDGVYYRAKADCEKKWGRNLIFVDVVMVHKDSITYLGWLQEYRKKHPGKPEPTDDLYFVKGGKQGPDSRA